MTTLRDYQLTAVQRARLLFTQGVRRILLVAPTGAGKTVIATEGIIRPAVAKSKRVLFLAHREELITQCAAKLGWVAPGTLGWTQPADALPVGIIKAGYAPTPWASVQVASVQTLGRRLANAPKADIVIWDEAHHCTAETYRKIAEAYPTQPHLGLTATPYRTGGKGLRGCFDALVEVASVPELINAGFLVRPRTFALPGPDLSGVKTVAGDYHEGQLADVMDRQMVGVALVKTWQRHAAGRSTIAFAVNVAHAQHIADEFRAAGITAEAVDGNTPPELRAAILGRLASGETMVVSNCGVLTEGFDCPRVSCVILARPTKSRSLWRQCVGRGLRTCFAKTDCQIHDHAGCRMLHGEVDAAEKLTLDGVETKPGSGPAVRQCLSCYAVVPAGTPACPECGTEFPKPKPAQVVDQVDAELVETDGRAVQRDGQELTPIERRVFFQLVHLAARRGWKAGAVSYRFKERFGRWPAKPAEVALHVAHAKAAYDASMRAAAEGRPATLDELDQIIPAEAVESVA